MPSRRILLVVAAVVLVLAVALATRRARWPAARRPAPSATAAADAAWVRAHYRKQEFSIPMRDGVRLFTAAYTPRDASPAHRYPFLVERTPFSVAPYGPDAYPRTLGPDRFTLHDGYIFVYQDVRGRYMSGGTFENVRPLLPDSVKARDSRATDEATDTYDTIEWLLAHVAGNDGKAGLWGISYAGFYAALGMMSGHPALVAASPQAPVTDLFFEDFHHDGALTAGYFTAYPIFGLTRPAPTSDNWWLSAYQRLQSLSRPDDYAWQLSLGPVGTFGARFYEGNTLWQDIVAHPDYDAFWQERAVAPQLGGVSLAVLVVGGWFDGEDLYGPLAVYRALRAHDPQTAVSLVMGPFGHRGWAAPDDAHTVAGNLYYGDSLAVRFQRDVEAPFFRAHLKGEGTAPATDALMFDTGRKTWVRFAAWPAAGAAPRAYYLHHDGSLTTARPAEIAAFRGYVSDPGAPVPTRCKGPTLDDYTLYMNGDQRCFDARPDVLTFESEPLAEPLTVAGPVAARLTVSTTGSDADFVVKLIDVYPADAPDDPWRPDTSVHLAGYQQLVRGEIMPGRFRRSFDSPAPLVPNERAEVDVHLQDVLHTFLRGHRIMIQVQSSWFPMFARNPQTWLPNPYGAQASDYVRATERVWVGRDGSSEVVLPVLR